MNISVQILRSFRVSDDGITSREVVAGTVDTIPEESAYGLADEGFIAFIGGAVAGDGTDDAPVVKRRPGRPPNKDRAQ